YLQSLRVGPEVPVGVALERSPEMVIAVLAILKAGGTYLPLDPAYPKPRLAYLLTDARVAVILTQTRLQKEFADAGVPVICLDTESTLLASPRDENPLNGASPENLAYITYTSGSTGQPKGVSVRHRAVVRLVKETNYVALTSGEVFLQLAPLAFDA